MIKQVESYWCKIYIAGDYQEIKTLCRQFCFDFPFCVTITPTTYIYQGGAEDGAEIGIISYAKFPKLKKQLFDIASELAGKIMERESQWCYTILTPSKSVWFSRRIDAINA